MKNGVREILTSLKRNSYNNRNIYYLRIYSVGTGRQYDRMVSIDEVYNKILQLNRAAKEIQRMATGSNELNEIGEQVERPKDPDETMKYNFVIRTLDKLDDISRDISYLQKPIRFRGVFHRNNRGHSSVPMNGLNVRVR